jgi:hypothetical protein
METLVAVKNLIPGFEYAIDLDIEDAYLHVAVHPEDRSKLLLDMRKQIWEPLCTLFGLSPSPRVFTKIMRVPIAILRGKGIIIKPADPAPTITTSHSAYSSISFM